MQFNAPLTAITEQSDETVLISGRGDYGYLIHPSQHHSAEGVVDHRLIVYRQQLFGDDPGDRVQSRAIST